MNPTIRLTARCLAGICSTLLLFVSISSLHAADEKTLGPDAFDFWVGDWDLKWTTPSGVEQSGSNSIEKILDGAVLQENFTAPSMKFSGKSWSVYNPETETWRQVWVDTTSTIMEFTGALVDGDPAFVMEAEEIKGKSVVRRMRFHSFTEDGFQWDWESNEVGTDDWKLLWRIHYRKQSD